ncbi:4Fe-4S cluster-binding domain-containing protein [Vibrio sp. PP-XX7]
MQSTAGNGMYFNIQRFSTHDGDGIRSILFLKGCSLSCPWCQNPESRSAKRSLFFDERHCLVDCNLCVNASQGIERCGETLMIDRQRIQEDELIALDNLCPAEALTVCGKAAEADVLFETLMKDKPFYDQSDGGVTFSGGNHSCSLIWWHHWQCVCMTPASRPQSNLACMYRGKILKKWPLISTAGWLT